LRQLNENLLKQDLTGTEVADFDTSLLDYPLRIVQIGEGNFLRAFFNWMVHEANKKGVFRGRSAVVQPIRPGKVKDLQEQDNLYTVVLRGIEDEKQIEEREIVTSIGRSLESYKNWNEILKLAENPEIDKVVSNTTEAGITYNPDDNYDDKPPESFPGKLTVFLHHRFKHFNGDEDGGMLIIPVELIERNGDRLKDIILQLADDWGLSPEFKEWISKDNYFLNTLVDRIVTGYPEKEIKTLESELGYRDVNLTTGEIFHLWIIEGDEELKDRLPLHEAGLNVKWVDDLKPYRTRKVRILNGAHTSTVPVAHLAGINIVREAINDDTVGQFIEHIIFEEIIPTLDFEREELESFAEKVIERFKNPYIDHKWLDISLNSTSKFKTRVLPSLIKYQEKFSELPDNLVFAFAALIKFYDGKEIEEDRMIAYKGEEKYTIKDDQQALEFFLDIWSDFHEGKIERAKLVEYALSNVNLWEKDLTEIPGLLEKVLEYLKLIDKEDMKEAMQKLSETE